MSFRALALYCLSICLVQLGVIVDLGHADAFRWIDKDGKEHYSTTPVPGATQLQELPQIQRENFAEKIKRIKEATPLSCETHGGIECGKGPDIDGSVICLDEFKDSALQFNSLCSDAKLQVGRVVYLDVSGKAVNLKSSRSISEIKTAKFTVRNMSGVLARSVTGELSFPRPSRRLTISGPSTVDPYGIAEYNAALSESSMPLDLEKLKGVRVRLRCDNCQILLGGN